MREIFDIRQSVFKSLSTWPFDVLEDYVSEAIVNSSVIYGDDLVLSKAELIKRVVNWIRQHLIDDIRKKKVIKRLGPKFYAPNEETLGVYLERLSVPDDEINECVDSITHEQARTVARLVLSGHNVAQIGELLDVRQRRVYVLIQRARDEVKDYRARRNSIAPIVKEAAALREPTIHDVDPYPYDPYEAALTRTRAYVNERFK